MFKAIRKNFVTGLAILFPAIVTLWLVKFVIAKANSGVLEPVIRLSRPYFNDNVALEGLARVALLIVFILVIALIGFGTRVLFLRTLFSYWERFVYRVPMVGRIYGVTRDMSKAFLGHSKGIFARVVLVEFPRKGIYSIGFVTSEGRGEVQDKTLEKVINVFVPTTPNPTSGFLLLVPEGEMIEMDMSVADGLKLVVSGGILPLPDSVSIKKKESA